MFFGNSSISPCITSDRPWMRQMPSVTETTVPCVRICAPASRFWIRLLISSLISEGLSCMAPKRLCFYAFSAASSAPSCARAEPSMTLSPSTTRTPPISSLSTWTLVLTLRPVFFSSALHQVGDLRLGELERRVHLGLEHAFALVLQRLELRADLAAAARGARSRPARARRFSASPFSRPARMPMKMPATCASLRLGLGHRRAHARVVRDQRRARRASPTTCASAPAPSASLKAASA